MCNCDNPLCGKCLGIGCQDDDCTIHTTELKIQNSRNRLSWYKPDSDSEEKKQLETEMERLRSVRMNRKKPL